MKVLKVAVVGALASVASLVALGAAFPDKNGSHDLTDPNAWDSWPLTSHVRIDKAGTYNCNTADTTFIGIWPNASGKDIVITNAPDRTTTLSGGTGDTIMYPYNGGVRLELRGGNWDFGGKTPQLADGNNTKFTLSGGVKLTNCNGLYGRTGTKTGDHGLEIKDAGTEVTAKSIGCGYANEVAYNEDGNPAQTGVVVDVHDGAKVTTTGSAAFDVAGGWMLLRGEGTKLNIDGTYSYVGGKQGGGLHVTDGASVTNSKSHFIMRQDTASIGKVLVDNGGSLITDSATLYLGGWSANDSHSNNWVIAGSDGTVQFAGIYGRSENNWLVASNGTLTIAGNGNFNFQPSDTYAYKSGFRVYGNKPKIVIGNANITANNLVFEWNLPDKPYATKDALITTTTMGTNKMKFTINGIADFVEAISETTEVTLMEATNADGHVPGAPVELARVNALLDAEAPGSYIYRTADTKKLILHARKRLGMTVILR